MARCHCTDPKKPVSVQDYERYRLSKWERVRTHCRKLPKVGHKGWNAQNPS